MKMPPFSTDGIVAASTGRKPRLPKSRLFAGLAMTLSLLAGGQADGAPVSPVVIGSMNNFQNGSNVSINGTWNLGDKDWTYLSRSGNWQGFESIELLENFDPSLQSHQFLVSNMSSYNSPQTLSVGYQVHINGNAGTQYFYDARMGENTSGATVLVWQDIYGSLIDFTNNTAPGSGTLMTHLSTNGSLPPAGLFPPFLIDIWVRNTVTLSGLGGQISSMGDTFRQVPEIDPTSFGSALSLLFGAFGILERRTRRRLSAAVTA
jgi:hypothetical protein